MQLAPDSKAKPKILVVEGDAIIALEIKRRLEQLGYEVPSTVADGREAICLVREELDKTITIVTKVNKVVPAKSPIF